jgi:hypothetical protein
MFMGRNLSDFSRELIRRQETMRDFVDTTHRMRMVNGKLEFGEDSRRYSFPVNKIAAQQIASFTGIPSAYYHRMRENAPALLDTNINAWLEKEDTTRMIRTLDGRARAFLSNKYLPIDNYEIAMRVLPVLARIIDLSDKNVSCEITDRNMYIKVVNYKMEREVTPGDIVQSGIIVTNSEVGQGMVSVMPFMNRLVCSNGMVIDIAAKKRRHVGKTIDLTQDDFQIYREETINAANQAFLMQIEDTVSAVADEVKFDRILDSMREAKDKKFTNKNIPAVVELATKKYGIAESAKDNILTHLIREGDTSLYGLANAVTRYSQDVEDYDTATDLEAIGGKMINMPQSLFNELNNASATKEQRKQERREQKARQADLLAA